MKVNKDKLSKYGLSFLVSFFRFVLLLGISFVILYPLATKVLTSFMTLDDIYDMSIKYIPKAITFDNYIKAWNFLGIKDLLWNTILIPLVVSLIHMVSATIVAYGFARYDFKFKGFFFFLVIIGMVIPPDLTLLPLYMSFKNFDIFGIFSLITGKSLNLLDTMGPFVILGLTCTGLKNGLYIFMMRQYFRGLPKELEEAAYVDGAGVLSAFVRIFLPSASQIMMTVFLFSYVWQWVDDIYTSAFMQNIPMLSTELSRLLNSASGVDSGFGNVAEFSLMRNAGIMFFILPLLVLYLICQKQFTESVERSGLVG